MNIRIFPALAALILAITVDAQTELPEHHRATRLGNPATRFAPPLATTGDLRALFRQETLRPDFVAILRQWGWPGRPDDFFAAGLTNEASEWEIPVGDTMPFMASRRDGKPVCLRHVTWAGTEPIQAYTFTFHSAGRIWRCITPKSCCNFFLEDLGAEPRAGLAVDCSVPAKVVIGRTVEIALHLYNTGNIPAARVTVVLPVPDGAVVLSSTEGGIVSSHLVTWTVTNLPAAALRQLGATLRTQKTGPLQFNPAASNGVVATGHCVCATEVVGIPAILLEKADDPDPVAIGDTTTYTVKVTNQGTADDSNVQVVVTIAPELVPLSVSEGRLVGQTVTLPLVVKLAPKAAVAYKIVAKGVSVGDGHTKFTLTSDVLKSPLIAEESTTVY